MTAVRRVLLSAVRRAGEPGEGVASSAPPSSALRRCARSDCDRGLSPTHLQVPGSRSIDVLVQNTLAPRSLYSHNMKRHPHKEIRKALDEAEAAGLTIIETSGHTWGYVRCACGQRIAVYSTARNPEHGAKLIRQFIRNHQEHS